MKPMPAAIQWKHRPHRVTSDLGWARTWETRCKTYRVRESYVTGLPVKIYAQVFRDGFWDVISQHRSRAAAKAACERHVKQEQTTGVTP